MTLDAQTPNTTIMTQVQTWAQANMTYDTTNEPVSYPNIGSAPTLNDTNPFHGIAKVLDVDTIPIEVGTDQTKEIQGVLSFQILGRIDRGEASQIALANSFRNHFSDQVYSTVQFLTGTVHSGLTVENKYQINVTVPYIVYQQ